MNTSTVIITILLLVIVIISIQKFLSGGTGIVILKKELKSIFYSPIAWIVMALVMLLNGFSFFGSGGDLVLQPVQRNNDN